MAEVTLFAHPADSKQHVKIHRTELWPAIVDWCNNMHVTSEARGESEGVTVKTVRLWFAGLCIVFEARQNVVWRKANRGMTGSQMVPVRNAQITELKIQHSCFSFIGHINDLLVWMENHINETMHQRILPPSEGKPVLTAASGAHCYNV